MKIQCDCGKFKAELGNVKKNSPGRLFCYCDDCQKYLKQIGREELLDDYGGTEIVPVYPNNYKITEGREHLKCNAISKRGLHRWTADCCNTPVANTLSKLPWVGVIHKAFTNADPDSLNKLGPVKSRIKGKFKTAEPPFKISDDASFKDLVPVIPFVVKGLLFKKSSESPFFKEDKKTPASEICLLK